MTRFHERVLIHSISPRAHGVSWYLMKRFSTVVNTHKRRSNKIYKTELTNRKIENQVMCKYQVDPHRVGLTLIVELTWSNLGLKEV